MASLKLFLVLAFAHCVFSGTLVKKHCDSESPDFATCVADIVEDFFRKNSGGLPEHNIKPVDPVTIPELIINDEKLGFKLIYKNVKITGFKDAIFSDFKIDTKEGRAEFSMKFDFDTEGDITTELTQGKTFTGTFKYEGTVKGDTKYSFYEKKVSNEKSVYTIGPETTVCSASNIKESYDKEVTDAFEKDPDTEKIRNEFKNTAFAKEYNEKVACKMAAVVFQQVMEVARTVAHLGV